MTWWREQDQVGLLGAARLVFAKKLLHEIPEPRRRETDVKALIGSVRIRFEVPTARR